MVPDVLVCHNVVVAGCLGSEYSGVIRMVPDGSVGHNVVVDYTTPSEG
jgi:hypothetical protein